MQTSCILFFYFVFMEINPFLWTLVWNIIVWVWILLVIFFVRYIKNKFINYLDYITATTVWLLISIIFLWFIPEIIYSWLDWRVVWIFIILGIFLFYILELFLHWHHCKDLWHTDSCDSHSHHDEHKNGVLIFGWTLLHNAFHWIVLFVAFSVNFHFWIATTLAILLHSIPQNVVNYIMNHKKSKYAYIWAFGWVFWALLTFPFSEFLVDHKAYVLAIIAWWLLYTALADIFPEFKWKWTTFKKISYFLFILLGIVLFLWFEKISWSEWEHDHSHEYHDEHEEEHEEDEEHEDDFWVIENH